MTGDAIVGIIAVVIGAVLGYLASYLNDRQQRRWRLDSEYRSWKRERTTSDMNSMFSFIRKYTEIALDYIEYAESPDDRLLKELFESKRADVKRYMKESETSFPISLKFGPTRSILEGLAKVTDEIVEISFSKKPNLNPEEMKTHLTAIRELERRLYSEYVEVIGNTFRT